MIFRYDNASLALAVETDKFCVVCHVFPRHRTKRALEHLHQKKLPKVVGKGRYNRKENRGISSFGRELTPFVTKRCP